MKSIKKGISGSKVMVTEGVDFASLVKLHWEVSAPAACTAGLFFVYCNWLALLLDVLILIPWTLKTNL